MTAITPDTDPFYQRDLSLKSRFIKHIARRVNNFLEKPLMGSTSEDDDQELSIFDPRPGNLAEQRREKLQRNTQHFDSVLRHEWLP